MTLAVDVSTMPAIPVTRTRSRTRAVDTSAPETNTRVIPKDLEAAVGEYLRLNQLANDASATAKKQKAKVEQLVSQNSLDGQKLQAIFKDQNYDYGIYSVTEDEVDLNKLKGLVSAEIFMKIVTASKGAVEEHAGTVIMNKSLSKVTKAASFKCAKQKKNALNG